MSISWDLICCLLTIRSHITQTLETNYMNTYKFSNTKKKEEKSIDYDNISNKVIVDKN